MKITEIVVKSFFITEIPGLDPITVILQDISPGRGKVVIECYGDAWSVYWGNMGSSDVRGFFLSCNPGYIARKLRRNHNNKKETSYTERIIIAVKEALDENNTNRQF